MISATSSLPASDKAVAGSAKRFTRVLPLAFITYSLAYLDRVNIGFGGAGGMRQTLHLQEWQFNWLNASFFVGYVLFQIPGTAYAARRSARRVLFWALVLWGIVASLTALLTNFYLLLIDRCLLGVVEGVVFPSLLVFLTHWFTRRERSRANTVLILGNPITVAWASVVSGWLVAYFDGHHLLQFDRAWHAITGEAKLAGWQVMLLAEGLPTLLWAAAWWWLAKDRPGDAAWLAPDEAARVVAALDAEQAAVKPIPNYRAAFANPRVILFSLLFFAWSIGIYGLNMWLPIITKTGSELGMASVGLLNAVPYLLSAVAMVIVSAMSDRTLKRRVFVWPFLMVGALAFLVSYLAGPNHFAISFGGLIVAAICMYAPYGPFWAMAPEYISRNVIGESLALINTIGAAGGFLGTLGVGELHRLTGGYGAGFAALATCLAVAGGLTLLIGTHGANPAGAGTTRINN